MARCDLRDEGRPLNDNAREALAFPLEFPRGKMTAWLWAGVVMGGSGLCEKYDASMRKSNKPLNAVDIARRFRQ